jgi:Zn-dependent protease
MSDTGHPWTPDEYAPDKSPVMNLPAPAYRPLPREGQAPEPLEPIHQHGPVRKLLSEAAAALVAVGALLLKFKSAVLVIFKLKMFTMALTMIASIVVYGRLWGWTFALGFVLLLFVHEAGHLLEARRQGLPVSLPLFIPFMGAAILLREMPHNAWREARVALAGPIVGTLAATAVWAASGAYQSDLLLAIAYTGFFINLFNLLPIVPLDGGRIVAAIHPWLWAAGLAGLLALAVVMPNPILLIILVLAAMDLVQRWQTRHEARARGYYEVGRWRRLAVAIVYFGLAVLLALAMSQTHVKRTI